jgi:hypothetical protein
MSALGSEPEFGRGLPLVRCVLARGEDLMSVLNDLKRGLQLRSLVPSITAGDTPAIIYVGTDMSLPALIFSEDPSRVLSRGVGLSMPPLVTG